MTRAVHIHIGLHKTATTYLQHALELNRSRLSDAGILYPRSAILESAHHRLFRELYSDDRFVDLAARPWLEPPLQLEDHPPLITLEPWGELGEELSDALHPDVVISSEDFAWLTRPDRVRELFHDDDLHVVVYLRRRDETVESYYQQLVKDDPPRLTMSFESYLRQPAPRFMDYLQVLDSWNAIADVISVRIYDGSDLVQGDILADFLETLDYGSLAVDLERPETNRVIAHKKSLDGYSLDAIRLLNKTHAEWDARREIVDRLIASNLGPKRTGRLFTQEARDEYLSQFREDDDELRRRYRPDLDELFPLPDEDSEFFQQISLTDEHGPEQTP